MEELPPGASAEEMPRRRTERSSTTWMASCIGGAPALYAGDWNEARFSATSASHRICGSVDQGRFATTASRTAWVPQTLRNSRRQFLLLGGQTLHRPFLPQRCHQLQSKSPLLRVSPCPCHHPIPGSGSVRGWSRVHEAGRRERARNSKGALRCRSTLMSRWVLPQYQSRAQPRRHGAGAAGLCLFILVTVWGDDGPQWRHQ